MPSSFIYVIGPSDQRVKIGYSKHPELRLAQLQTGHDQELKIHYIREDDAKLIPLMEQVIHHQLRHHKIHGEWFNLTAEDARLEVDHAFIRYAEIPNLALRLRNRSL